jgi:hypothetical protein
MLEENYKASRKHIRVDGMPLDKGVAATAMSN